MHVAPSEVIGSGESLTLAVLPHMVEVLPVGDEGIPAQVRSVLYDAGSWSLTNGPRPAVGDRVTIRIHGPLGYRS